MAPTARIEGAPSAVVAREDASLSARVVSRRALRYAAGASLADDRPAHVRAGSALACLGSRLAVIQDDASFVALVDPATGLADAVALPPGPGGLRLFDDGRGNKRHKLDLEACIVVGDRLIAFGSGSTPARERIVVIHGIVSRTGRTCPGPSGLVPGTSAASDAAARAARVDVVDARAFYAELRGRTDFSGSELNVEGAVYLESSRRIVLCQRGNGGARGALSPVDATCAIEVDTFTAFLEARGAAVPPRIEDVTRYDLGSIDGVRLTLTDLALREPALWFLAAAEACPDAVADGPVAGVVLGIVDGAAARWTRIIGLDGAPLRDKAEGLALDPANPRSAWVVLDRDDPNVASELCEVEIGGSMR